MTQDFFEGQEHALEASSQNAGEFLASINKSDLASFQTSEWHDLIKVIILAWESERIPF